MASVVNRSQFPSRSTGQLDGVRRWFHLHLFAGASRHMKAGGLICWHVRDYRIQTAFADLELQPHIPSSTPAQVVGLNVNDWVWRLAGMFCPVDYLLEIVASILKQDDVELAKIYPSPCRSSPGLFSKSCAWPKRWRIYRMRRPMTQGKADSIAYHLMQGALSVASLGSKAW